MLAKSNSGGLHLVYDITDPYVHYRHRTSSGTWESAVGLAPGKFPDVAEDTDNKVHVVYTKTDGRENMTLAEAVRTNGSWDSGTDIYSGMNWYSRIVRGVSGKVSLIDNAGTSHNVSFATKNGSWPSLTTIGTSARYGTPDLAMGTDGVYHAVWISGNILKYRKYNGSWQTETNVATGSGYMMPRIALDSSNNPVVVWLGDYKSSGYQVNFTRWTGSAWTSPDVIGYGHYPVVAVDQNNKIHVAYSTIVGSKYDVLHLVYNGGGWTTAKNLSNNAGDSLRPAIEVTADNGVHIAWSDDSNRTNSQIFWATSASIPTTGTISGTVKDTNNNPIQGATVSTNTGGYTTTSASDGSYTLSAVAPGTYNVTASKAGYNSQTQSNKTVTAGQITTVNFNLTLVPGTISGTVKDASNNGIVGATVTTSPGNYSATTGSGGAYTINNVPQGTYDVTASKSGYLSDTQTGKTVTSGQTTTVNFTLYSNRGKISGTVKDECGDVIGGATVSTNTGGYTTTSLEDGTYLLDDVVAGTYSVTASKSGFNSATNNNVSVTAGNTTVSNFALQAITQQEKLVNGSFDAGFFTFWGGSMANDWGATWRSTPDGTTWGSYNAGGGYGYAQSVYVNNQNSEAGILQVVTGLTPGSNYTFSAYAYQTSTNSTCWIGTDPNGGTTMPSRTTAFTNTPGQWNYQSVSGTVGSSGTVTVFLWVWHQWNPAGNCYFNNASLMVTKPGTPGKIMGFVKDQNNNPVSGATVATSTGGYTTTSAADGSYAINDVTPATYSVTASKTGYNSDTKNVTVTNCSTAVCDFTLTLPSEKVTNGDMEGGFFNTGWGSDCSGQPSMLPGPQGKWGWNNESGYPINTFDSTSIKHGGSHSCGISFCQTASSPGKIGIIWQTVNLGGAGVSKTFRVWAYHTNGNCPSIMCWNPGPDQADPYVAYYNGRYQWVTVDNWGQLNTWVTRTMTVTADANGYVTIMAGGAAHPGTTSGDPVYIDDVSVQ